MPLWLSVVALFVVAMIGFSLLMNQVDRGKLKKNLQKSWGNLLHTWRKKDSIESLQLSLLAQKNHLKYDYFVDDETWENLSLEEIFWQINNTQTSLGAEALYAKMRLLRFSKDKDFEDLKTYFSNHQSEREQIRFILAGLGKKNSNQAFQIVNDSGLKEIKNDKIYVFLGLLPILSLLLLLVNPSVAGMVALASVMFNITFYLSRKFALNLELERMSYLVQVIYTAKKMSEINFPFKAQLVQDLKHFKSLTWLSYVFSHYQNDVSDTSMFFEYLNSIFMIPFIAYSRLKSILFKYNHNMEEMLEIIAQIDSAIATISTLEFYENYCIPEFSDKKGIKAVEAYHPLLENPVSNSVDFSDNILISGDNASGKSTFMKTIAVNSLLAQSLNFALAKEFSLSYGGLSTSMNIGDNVLVKESHFVAEGRRIKELLDKVSDSQFNYLFLDEIFSGTNSAERVSIGFSLMKWLSERNCLYMITTHDIELIKIGKEITSNYYFISNSSGDGNNDYKIKPGTSDKTNAIKTLDKLGYPKQIIQASQDNLKTIMDKTYDK